MDERPVIWVRMSDPHSIFPLRPDTITMYGYDVRFDTWVVIPHRQARVWLSSHDRSILVDGINSSNEMWAFQIMKAAAKLLDEYESNKSKKEQEDMPGNKPKPFPTRKWPEVMELRNATFISISNDGDVRYQKMASGLGRNAVVNAAAKVKLGEFIAFAASSEGSVKLYISWPGITQDIFEVNPDDYEMMLGHLGFVSEEQLTVEVNGKKFVHRGR